MLKVKEKKETKKNVSNYVKFYVFLNGNNKIFSGEKKDALKELNKEIASYGKKLHSLKLTIEEKRKTYMFSLLSAVHYITTGQISER